MRTSLLTVLLGVLLNAFIASPVQASHYEQIKENIDTLTVDITLYPFKEGQKAPEGGLRSLLLYTPDRLIEPHARWQDGSPISADAKITPKDIVGIIDTLQSLKILQQAALYYSEARPNPKSKPPAGKSRASYRRTAEPSCVITMTYTSGDYRAYVVCTIPFGKETLKTLNHLEAQVPKSVLSQLQETCQRF